MGASFSWFDGSRAPGSRCHPAATRGRPGAENLGDELHEGVDDAARKLEYERGRADQARDEEADRR
jgi:hypothetical protein